VVSIDPVHILYLIPTLNGSGGAEQAIGALAGPLSARGVTLEVLTLSPPRGSEAGNLAARVEQAGADVSVLGPGRSRLSLIPRLRRVVVERRPDLVHTTLFDADVIGRVGGWLARTPVVSSLVNVAYGPEQRANPALVPWKLEAVRWADRLTARSVRRFHALSPHVATVMGRRLGIRPEQIDVIPRGRDPRCLGAPSEDRRRRVRARLGLDDDQPLVIAAARHEYQKGLDVLLAAWPSVRADLPRAELRIGGRSGSETFALERQAAAQGASSGIAFLGLRDDIPDLLVAADAFVVPSRWEGLGSILVEAMALGARVVASDVGPIPDLVGSGWARLVPPEQPSVLARTIIETIGQDPADAARRADVARSRFDASFGIDVVADATAAFYERALE
jgi:glycosyltransferase involved in cell wall biosynthesis